MKCPACLKPMREIIQKRVIVVNGRIISVYREFKCPRGCSNPYDKLEGKDAWLKFRYEE